MTKFSEEITQEKLSWRRLFVAEAKLKASSRTSALLSGFAMVAMVETDVGKNIPLGLVITFAIITTLVVVVHLLALMISTCILPHIESVAMAQHLNHEQIRPFGVKESPHEEMHVYIELAWLFSTGLGIMLFMVQMAVMAWVRFYPAGYEAPLASTIVIIPCLVIFVIFAVHFYRKLVSRKSRQHQEQLEEMYSMVRDLDSKKPAV